MKKNSKIISTSALIIIGAFTVSFILKHVKNNSQDISKYKTSDIKFKEKLKSGNLSTDYTIDQAMNDIEELNLNTINIPIVIRIDSLNASEMIVDEYSVEKAINLIKKIKPLGTKIILEAYPWINNGGEYETEWVPDKIDDFFYNWQHKVLKILIEKIANPYDVYAINVGSNFTNMEKYTEKWGSIIDALRSEYSGFITYRTNFWYTAYGDSSTENNFEEKLNNPLFEKVDFISIASYFELTDEETNSVEQLTECIEKSKRLNRKQPIKKQIKALSDKWNKPIFFGELGFVRSKGCAIEPWNFENFKKEDSKEQAKCFEAYKNQFEKEEWHLGFSVFAIGEKSEDKKYYPSEESKEIIKAWYK